MNTELKSFEEIKQLLVEAAKGAGIISNEKYTLFQNCGYQSGCTLAESFAPNRRRKYCISM